MVTVQLNGNGSQGTTKAREPSIAEWCLDSENITTTIKSAKKPHGKIIQQMPVLRMANLRERKSSIMRTNDLRLLFRSWSASIYSREDDLLQVHFYFLYKRLTKKRLETDSCFRRQYDY